MKKRVRVTDVRKATKKWTRRGWDVWFECPICGRVFSTLPWFLRGTHKCHEKEEVICCTEMGGRDG